MVKPCFWASGVWGDSGEPLEGARPGLCTQERFAVSALGRKAVTAVITGVTVPGAAF